MNSKKRNKKRNTLILVLAWIVGTSVFAQNSSENQHALLHKDLLANQSRVSKEVRLLEDLIEDYIVKAYYDFNLSDDLYANGNDQLVNPYRNQKVEFPDSFLINVSD